MNHDYTRGGLYTKFDSWSIVRSLFTDLLLCELKLHFSSVQFTKFDINARTCENEYGTICQVFFRSHMLNFPL